MLDAGEREAIQLAEETHADLLIIDEKRGRALAMQRNIRVVGTLGILGEAAELGLIDFAETLRRLQKTNFHLSDKLMHELLARFQK